MILCWRPAGTLGRDRPGFVIMGIPSVFMDYTLKYRRRVNRDEVPARTTPSPMRAGAINSVWAGEMNAVSGYCLDMYSPRKKWATAHSVPDARAAPMTAAITPSRMNGSWITDLGGAHEPHDARLATPAERRQPDGGGNEQDGANRHDTRDAHRDQGGCVHDGKQPLQDLTLIDHRLHARLGGKGLTDDLVFFRILHVDPEGCGKLVRGDGIDDRRVRELFLEVLVGIFLGLKLEVVDVLGHRR